MTRIAVVGNAGGGKTYLCAKLGRSLGFPVFSFDAIQWRPGWVPTSPEEVERKHDEWIGQGTWIIDGFGSWEQIEARFEAADTIILVDHPLYIHYWWALKRQVQYAFRPRPDLPENCPMLPVTWELLKMIRNVHRREMPRLRSMVGAMEGRKRVIRLTSPRQMKDFIANPV